MEIKLDLPEFISENVKISEIEIGERKRKDLGDLSGLKQSIVETGLINPITLQKTENGFLLMAGHRRLTCCTEMGWEEIPARYSNKVDALHLAMIELAENLHRKPFDFMEEINAKAAVHETMQKLYGQKMKGSATGHGINDTARMFGETATNTSRDLRLASTLNQLPDDVKQTIFAGCKTKEEANARIKSLTNKAKTSIAAKAAKDVMKEGDRLQRLTKAFQVLPIIKDAPIEEYGCLKGYQSIPDESVDFTEIDPPYAINLTEMKKNSVMEQITEYNELTITEYKTLMGKLAEQCYRTHKKDTCLICWFAFQHYGITKKAFESAGFTVPGLPWIWAKEKFAGQTNAPLTSPGKAWEIFFVAKKGNPQLAKPGCTNLLIHQPIASGKIHPTQRPGSMIVEIMRRLVHPGSFVVVPFLGSGETLLACEYLNHKAIGFEVSNAYKNAYILRAAKFDDINFELDNN